MYFITWRKILIPTIFDIISYTLLTIGIIVASNMQAIINHLTGSTSSNNQAFQASVSDQLSGISKNALASHLTVILFWGFVGLVVYTIFWLGLNFIISLKNEVVVEADYVNKARFIDRVRVPLTQIGAGTLLFGFAALCLKILFPLWIGLSHIFFHNISILNPQLVLQLLGAFVGSWLTFYIGWTTLKLIQDLRD